MNEKRQIRLGKFITTIKTDLTTFPCQLGDFAAFAQNELFLIANSSTLRVIAQNAHYIINFYYTSRKYIWKRENFPSKFHRAIYFKVVRNNIRVWLYRESKNFPTFFKKFSRDMNYYFI